MGDVSDAAAWVVVGFAVLVGACVGSFLNVVGYRVPRGRSVVRPPSSCPGCGRLIGWRDNVPVVSWCVLRGRCRSCGTSIPVAYLLVEVLVAVLAGLVAALALWSSPVVAAVVGVAAVVVLVVVVPRAHAVRS